MVNIDLDDVVGYGFVYYVVNIDLDDVVGYHVYIMWST